MPTGRREPPLECHEVDASRWDDVVQLFEGPGGPRYCWCLLWRESGRVRAHLDLAGRRAAMEARVRGGVPVGLLGYVDGAPVAWCSVAPRDTYRALGGLPDVEGEVVWSIVCFFVRREYRRRGVSAALLRAAIDAARRHGADVVEAYPVAPDSPSYRFMGQRSTFLAAGFVAHGMAGTRRHVMRLALREGG